MISRLMHQWRTLATCAALIGASGCIAQSVRKTGAEHASEMIEFQYQQIADNLARFVWEENSLPSNVTITGGIAQVSDRISPSISMPFDTTEQVQGQASVGLERQWTVNWNIRPVIEGDSLVALQGLYRDQVKYNIPEGQQNLGRKGKEATSNAEKMPRPTQPMPTTQTAPWFTTSKPDDSSKVAYTGTHRNVTIYVLAEGMEQFSAFTVQILRNSPKVTIMDGGGGIPALNP